MGRIITTGTFDGLHLGHMELLEQMKGFGGRHGLEPMVVTFDRHPLTEIAPQRVPGLLLLPTVRNRKLRAAGVEVVEIPFDALMRGVSASEWMALLRRDYDAEALMLGYDNTFGSDGATMNVADYRRLGTSHGLEILTASVVPGVSSSAIRKAIAEGRIGDADGMLGYDWEIPGRVVHGRGMGRNLGFPTANIATDPRLQLPANGVYASTVTLDDGSSFRAVTNVGRRPTFGENGPVSIETHLLGFNGDIYGRRLSLRPLAFLRGEQRFDSLDSLKKQIAADVEETLSLKNT